MTKETGVVEEKTNKKKEIRYFSTAMGGVLGKTDSPADVKRKVDGYLADGWEIIYTLLVDNGTDATGMQKGLNVYHVFTR